MGISAKDVIEQIIRPTLLGLNMQGVAAEQLIAGTIAHESLMGLYLRQQVGPAKGICQMEATTHDDIYDSYLRFHDDISQRLYIVSNLSIPRAYMIPPSDLMIFNLRYAVAMCRIHYYRQSDPLPLANDVNAIAAYWKKYYNTNFGKGDEIDFIRNYKIFVAPYYT